MVAADFLQNPQVRHWLDGVEPAWTLLAFDGLRALRQEHSAGQSAIRIATELSRFFDESLQNMRPIITRRELTFRWGRAPYTRSIERFGDIVAHPVLGGSHLGTLESKYSEATARGGASAYG